MKYLIELLLFLLFFTSCNPEERLQKAINGIGQEDAFMGKSVGFAGSKPAAYKHYETVLDLASPEQLQQMTSDERPAVRMYGFQGMVETNHPETFAAFKVLAGDSAVLRTMSGCVIMSNHVNILAADLLANDYLQKDHYQFKKQERVIFDSLLLFSDDFLLVPWSSAIGSVAPADQHYDRIKVLAVDSNYLLAWSGLANFNREEDLPLLRENFSFNNETIYSMTLDVIFRYPHPSFLKNLADAQHRLLRRKGGSYDFAELYLAVFQYAPEEISPFLNTIDDYEDQEKADAHRKGFWVAAQLHQSPAKRNLAKRIPKSLHDADELNWRRDLARYSDLD